MVTANLLINSVAHTTIEILLNSLWQGIALTALAWLVLRAMRRANAATRYGFLCATLLALIALPVCNAVSTLRGTRSGIHPLTHETSNLPPGALPASIETTRTVGEPFVVQEQHKSVGAEEDAAGESKPDRKASGERMNVVGAGGASQSRRWSPEIQLPTGNWLLPLFVVWLFVAALRVGRVYLSFRRLRRLKRTSSPLAPEHERRLRRLAADCQIKRRVKLGGLNGIGVPMVVGLLNPFIIFPQTLVEELTEDEFNLILLHELGHVRRWDDWMNVGQKLVEAVLFFHPAVLWVGKRLNLEREIACDDHVVSVTQESRHYATCLARLAELTLLPRRASLAPGAIFSKKQIFSRVELLLKRERNTNPHVSKPALLVPLGVLMTLIIQFLLLSPVIAVSEETVEDAPRSDTAASDQAPIETKTGTADSLRRAGEGSHDNVADGELRHDSQEASEEITVGQHSQALSIAGVPSRSRAFDVADTANNRTGQEGDTLQSATSLAAEKRKVERVDDLMASISEMSSGWDKADALMAVLARKSSLDSVPDGFFKVWKTIPSPMDKTRVLSALLAKRVGKGLLVQTLRAIPVVETESDKAKLLTTAARVCPMDDALLNVYLQVVAVLKSSSDQEQVLSALLERSGLSRNILLQTKALALSRIASTQSQQHVIDKVNLRLAETERS